MTAALDYPDKRVLAPIALNDAVITISTDVPNGIIPGSRVTIDQEVMVVLDIDTQPHTSANVTTFIVKRGIEGTGSPQVHAIGAPVRLTPLLPPLPPPPPPSAFDGLPQLMPNAISGATVTSPSTKTLVVYVSCPSVNVRVTINGVFVGALSGYLNFILPAGSTYSLAFTVGCGFQTPAVTAFS